MPEIILDTILDSVKILSFLFIAFLIIELFEHKLSKKTENTIKKAGKLGPLVGGILGAIPQCGFSVLATNLYITRIISLGTLISIYLSTSDEMLPILIAQNAPIKDILLLISIKIVIGFISGFIIDLLIKKEKPKKHFDICEGYGNSAQRAVRHSGGRRFVQDTGCRYRSKGHAGQITEKHFGHQAAAGRGHL